MQSWQKAGRSIIDVIAYSNCRAVRREHRLPYYKKKGPQAVRDGCETPRDPVAWRGLERNKARTWSAQKTRVGGQNGVTV